MNYGKGEYAEQVFICKAMARGFSVARPIGIKPYDLIVEKKGILFRIQVKSTFSGPIGAGQYVVASVKSAGNHYEDDAFHYYAVYIADLDLFYLIPFKLVSVKKISVRPAHPDCPYKTYRDNWELYLCVS